MEEMPSLWSHQESNDELKLKIHYTALELEAVKAKANEEMNKNTESVKQLLHLLKLVCHERDEANDQIQKLLNKIMHPINKSIIHECFAIDQVHQHHQYPLIKPAKANSSIAESNSLSDAYNHCSSPVNSLTSPEFSNINTNTSLVQDYRMLLNGFHVMRSPLESKHAVLVMESMIKGKALPQKGNLLKAVTEAGPLLQTLFATNPLPSWGNLSPQQFWNGGQNQTTMMTNHSQELSKMCYGSFSQIIGGGGGSFLSFNDMNSSNFEGRILGASCPMASNFGPVEKRQRIR